MTWQERAPYVPHRPLCPGPRRQRAQQHGRFPADTMSELPAGDHGGSTVAFALNDVTTVSTELHDPLAHTGREPLCPRRGPAVSLNPGGFVLPARQDSPSLQTIRRPLREKLRGN